MRMRQDRDSQTVRNRFQDRCLTSIPLRVGGERVTVRALAMKDSWVLVTRERAEAVRREEGGK